MSKQWLGIGLRIIPFVITAVEAVERLVKAKGKDKESAALDMVAELVRSAEGIAGKELVKDEDVQAALRNVIAAFVAFQNLVRNKRALADPTDPAPA